MDPTDEYLVLDRGTTCTEWYRLWTSLGFNEHQWIARAEKVEEYTRKFLDQTLITYKEQLVKRRQLLKQSIDEYEDLKERTGVNLTIDKMLLEEMKLKEQEMYIDRKMQELIISEDQLIHRRTDFEHKQKYLCQTLNTTPLEFQSHEPLTLIQMNEKLQDHLKMLNDLKDLRQSQVSSYYCKLKEYAEQLEWKPPSSSSVLNALFQKHFDRCLTADALNEIESTVHQLEEKLIEQKNRFDSLRQQLEHLCHRLGKNRTLPFQSAANEQINAFMIRQLQKEIDLCREERMQHGKAYCQSMGEQMKDLICKARLGDAERAVLEKLQSEPLSSDLLDAYDAELERLEKLYRQRQPVLDAYKKWSDFWNEYLAFTKSSTDPGRFHVRGYNAENEARQRKKFQRELPLIEEEFLQILSEQNDSPFLLDNEPIRQLFERAHHQLPSLNTPRKAVVARLTPVRSRTPLETPRRINATKEPFLLGTACSSVARRLIKTPVATATMHPTKKVSNTKGICQTEKQPIRSKPRRAPLFTSSPNHALAKLPVHPPASTGDQSLDFSLLHTIKNIHGELKIMTSTPNSSVLFGSNRLDQGGKTAHNAIGRRKSKRRSKCTPLPLVTVESSNDETILCL